VGAIFGPYLAVGAVASVLMLIGTAVSIGTFVVIVIANRADPDPSGRRPLAAYAFGVSFVTLWTSLVGALVVVWSLVARIGSQSGVAASMSGVFGDATWRAVVLGGIIFLVSMAAWLSHQRRGAALADAEGNASGPVGRVQRSYVAAVSFVSVMIMVGALIFAAYSVFELIAPGVFGGSRTDGLRILLDTGFLAVAVALIRSQHLDMTSDGTRPAVSPEPSRDE
jgi:hypothetical protein